MGKLSLKRTSIPRTPSPEIPPPYREPPAGPSEPQHQRDKPQDRPQDQQGQQGEPDQPPDFDDIVDAYDESAVPAWSPAVNRDGNLDIEIDDAWADAVPAVPVETPTVREFAVDTLHYRECPPLNVVMFVVGSRGDVLPFIALALQLILTRGHRVRIATHPDFANLVSSSAHTHLPGVDAFGEPLAVHLEHFNIGGNPHGVMTYMVKDLGLIPGLGIMAGRTVRAKRAMVKDMLLGCYIACFTPSEERPFSADAIISNPAAVAHIHVAEALGIPLHMSYTMPWTPTTEFPHPLVKAKSKKSDASVNNYSSYILANALMWQGIGDVINSFRVSVLGLQSLEMSVGPLVLHRLRIPFTYAWSRALVEKPKDWKENIDVAGFYSIPPDSGYVPDPALAEFLHMGEPPIYIGFGSMVGPNPQELIRTVLSALGKAHVRAILSGHLFLAGDIDWPKSIFLLEDEIPHDWLFANGRVRAVCHHGSAGVTAAGLGAGLPSIIVPFNGDQWFWGNAVHSAGAGPPPIAIADLTDETLYRAIEFALSLDTRSASQELSRRIRSQNATERGVESFHRHLPLLTMRCEILDNRTAIWFSEKYCIRLSAAVAGVLVETTNLTWKALTPHRPISYDATRHYADPFTGAAKTLLDMGASIAVGTSQMFYAPHKGLGNLMYRVPKAGFDLVYSIQEGLDNVPGMVGSPMRRRREVNSLTSGLTEGVKGLGLGVWDGVTGLVTEPYHGAKKNGVNGMLEGAAASWVSLPARLGSAGFGLVVHPTTGAWRGAKRQVQRVRMWGNSPTSALHDARVEQSHTEAGHLSAAERRRVVDMWHVLRTEKNIRQRRRTAEERRYEAEAVHLADAGQPLKKSLKGSRKGKGRADDITSASTEGIDGSSLQERRSSDASSARRSSEAPSANRRSSVFSLLRKTGERKAQRSDAGDARASQAVGEFSGDALLDEDPLEVEVHPPGYDRDMLSPAPDALSPAQSLDSKRPFRHDERRTMDKPGDDDDDFGASGHLPAYQASNTDTYSSYDTESNYAGWTDDPAKRRLQSVSETTSTTDVALAGTERWAEQSVASSMAADTEGVSPGGARLGRRKASLWKGKGKAK